MIPNRFHIFTEPRKEHRRARIGTSISFRKPQVFIPFEIFALRWPAEQFDIAIVEAITKDEIIAVAYE